MHDHPFLKMHGAGNDFIVARFAAPEALFGLHVPGLAHRQTGIGFDQAVWLLPDADGADIAMRIINADGSEVSACGNATRCVAWLLMEETGRAEVTIRTQAGLLRGKREGAGVVVDMGAPKLDWTEIPLAEAADTRSLPLHSGLPPAALVSMGNPHAVFFVEDAAGVDLAALGPALEHHPLFPERANISFATVTGPEDITLRVWERGAGVTLACGTAACATLVAAVERGLIPGRKARLHLPGGVLPVEWDADGHVWLGGPVAVAFTGSFRVEDYLRT